MALQGCHPTPVEPASASTPGAQERHVQCHAGVRFDTAAGEAALPDELETGELPVKTDSGSEVRAISVIRFKYFRAETLEVS